MSWKSSVGFGILLLCIEHSNVSMEKQYFQSFIPLFPVPQCIRSGGTYFKTCCNYIRNGLITATQTWYVVGVCVCVRARIMRDA
jgi:hypothetical protein